MKIKTEEYDIHLINTFRTTHGARDVMQILIVNIDEGLGEASPVHYYGEDLNTVRNFINKAAGKIDIDPFQLEKLSFDLEKVGAFNYSAKAAIDMAMHDLTAKKLGIPLYKFFGITPRTDLATSFTISISDPDTMKKQTEKNKGYHVYKVKVGVPGDIEMIEAVRDATDAKIRVDANEGWNVKEAISKIRKLEKLDVEFIEQPLHRDDFDGFRILRSKTELPIIVDEGVFRSTDIPKYVGLADGINIKLSKSGGVREGMKMISVARAHKMKVMIGCMVETSVGITAAAQIASLADYADLDGNILISDDPFKGVEIVNGYIKLPDGPGLGVVKR
ncbi:MAG: dipeptide epimerase [Candidatus Zixiibacteriota bacterium]|nr:MAG: dipeptide epimerase [candidate division Zixibacteria bacterium]